MKPGFSKRALLEQITAAGARARLYNDDYRCKAFIANLCGRLEVSDPEIAKALAEGAGMSHLYQPKDDKAGNA